MPTGKRFRAGLAALIAGCLALLATGGVARARAVAPGFRTPVAMPSGDRGDEPSLAIDAAGVRYLSWQSPGEFASSRDGRRFTNTGMPDAGALGDVTNATDSTGALYDAQICGGATALHDCVYRSTDGGRTWPVKTQAADMHPGAADRPWIDVYPRTREESSPDDTTVYLEYHTFSPDDLLYVTVSTDGGKTFSPPHVPGADAAALNGSACNTIPSGITVDQSNGWVYAAWLSGEDAASDASTGCNYSQIGPFDRAWVAVSKDRGQTWTSHLAWHGSFDPKTKVGDNADKIFGWISVDRGHQVHMMLSVRHHDDPVGFVQRCESGGSCEETPNATNMYLVTSPDAGAHWTRPLRVDRTTGSYFFPAIAAGSKGIVDAAYYRSSTLRPNDARSVWFAGFTQIRGAVAKLSGTRAVYVRAPQIAEGNLDTRAVHRGGICSFGIFCSVVSGSNRSLADNLAIALDPVGGANVSWTDDLQAKVRRVMFSCQINGPSAFLEDLSINDCYTAPPPARAHMVT